MLQVLITRGHGGFAFSIAGNNPVRVSRLDTGGWRETNILYHSDCRIWFNFLFKIIPSNNSMISKEILFEYNNCNCFGMLLNGIYILCEM